VLQCPGFISRGEEQSHTLYPSFSFEATRAVLEPLLRVLVTAGVSRLRTLNRFTLADVSWSRPLTLDDVVDELGRRSRRLPPENQGIESQNLQTNRDLVEEYVRIRGSRAVREPSSSSAQIKNAWSHTFIAPYVFIAYCFNTHRKTLPLGLSSASG
jgi:hypothetical protein